MPLQSTLFQYPLKCNIAWITIQSHAQRRKSQPYRLPRFSFKAKAKTGRSKNIETQDKVVIAALLHCVRTGNDQRLSGLFFCQTREVSQSDQFSTFSGSSDCNWVSAASRARSSPSVVESAAISMFGRATSKVTLITRLESDRQSLHPGCLRT